MDSGLKKLFYMIGALIIGATIFTFVRIHKGKEKYKEQIRKLEVVLKEWGEEYSDMMPQKKGESITIPLRTLKQANFIKDNFKNPKKGGKFSNQLLMEIKKVDKGYEYQVLEQDEYMVADYDDLNTEAPMVILNGNHIEYTELNTPYEELGYQAITRTGKKEDEVKIEIRENEKPVSKIDTSKLATYHVTYHISYAKETSDITRIVIVRDTEKPKIKMERLFIKTDEVKNLDLLKGVEITDNSKKDLKIKIIGGLSTIPGRYVLTYQAIDASGNICEKKRIVRVEEK